MTDEELIARLRDAVNGEHDMTPHGADVMQAANRIEQLVVTNEALIAENERLGQQCKGLMQAAMNNGQALILAEAKLAKAVEVLTGLEKSASHVSRYGATTGPQWLKMSVGILFARATLAEIKGDTHE
jgi:hypothetical protein